MSVVEKVRLSVYITHPSAGRTWTSLTAPDSTSTGVWGDSLLHLHTTLLDSDDFGSGPADADRTTLDDDATLGIASPSAVSPRAGTFFPWAPLSELIGATAEGTWTLHIEGFEPGTGPGILHAASVFLTVAGVETRYDIPGLPASIPDSPSFAVPGVLEVTFAVVAPPPAPADTDAAFEVRITPLFKPQPGLAGVLPEVANDTTIVAIDEADTILVTQYADLNVEHSHNEGRTGKVTISMYDAILDAPPFEIEEYACALWIGFRRPGETLAEGILYGQCNVVDNYDDTATVVLEAQDPFIGKATHHYIRRGDNALNVDSERGRVNADVFGISTILDAARNTPEQMAREMPAFALGEAYDPAAPDGPPFDLERGQEAAALVHEIVKQGPSPGYPAAPDIDIVPAWGWPTKAYATMRMLKAPGDPAAPAFGQLGRNLDPADPDAPAGGDVIFERGVGQSNLVSCNRTPDLPSTHVHVLDESGKYRVTGVDEASSAEVGAFVNWIATQLTIRRPHIHVGLGGTRTLVPADTSALQAIANAHIKAYGKPVGHVTMVLMAPDTPGMYQYGHPDWAAATGGLGIGGDWYMGDYVRARAVTGFRSFSELVRIDKVTFSTEGWNGLPNVQVGAVPAVGGSLAPDSTDGV